MKNLVHLFFLICFSQNLVSQKVERSFLNDSIDTYIEEGIRDWKIPGLGLAIVKNGKVIKGKGYGFANLENKIIFDSKTLFPIGSTTKHITSSALLRELRKHNIELDESITDLTKDYKFPDFIDTNSITYRELLGMKLGYKKHQGNFLLFESDFTSKEMVEKVWSVKPYYGRKIWGYHNPAYVLAGEMVSQLSNTEFPDYITENFFQPLRMTSTKTSYKGFLSNDNRIIPYVKEGDTLKKVNYVQLDKVIAAGGVYSNLNDMSRWMIMLLNEGKFNKNQILDTKIIDELSTPISNTGPGGHFFHKVSGRKYGLGLRIQQYDGVKLVEHGGGLPGVINHMILLPEKNIGILIFCNYSSNHFLSALRLELLDHFLNLPYRDYNTLIKNKYKVNVTPKISYSSFSKDQKTNLIGNYHNKIYGNINIREENGQIKLYLEHHPKTIGTLHLKENGDIECTFNSNQFQPGTISLIENTNKSKLQFNMNPDFDPNTYTFFKIK